MNLTTRSSGSEYISLHLLSLTVTPVRHNFNPACILEGKCSCAQCRKTSNGEGSGRRQPKRYRCFRRERLARLHLALGMKTHPLVGKNASELMINRQRRDSKEDKKRNDTVRSSKLSALRSTMTPIRPATSMNFPLTCRSGQRHEYIFSYFTSSPETCTLKKLLT